jgi:Tfp pilus assembly protein PilF
MCNHGILYTTLMACLCCSVGIVPQARAAPYIPADDAQVIERLPGRNDPARQELQRLRKELTAEPQNLARALALAHRTIRQAREEGDPRYLGYAQAALSPWWNLSDPPVEVRVLRATILQSTHQFAPALRELDAVLKIDQRNAQAWLTHATILMVQGEYEAAKRSCARLLRLASALVTQTCLANIAGLSGNAAHSYASLSTALERNADAEPEIKLWVSGILAEMAARRGDPAAAEKHFRQALSIDASDNYLLGAYADFLLDQNRADEVIGLLKNKTRADNLLLRYALALKAKNLPAAAQQIQVLESRFAAALMRADTTHQREQARFELQLADHPAAALKLAQQNWQVQKEPADARIFLEAALAAHDKTTARPVLEWLEKTGLEDRTLAILASKLTQR